MKKNVQMLGLMTAILAFSTVKAQTQTINFEDLTLSPQSYYNGADSAGGFTSNGLFFSTDYNTEFGYWVDGWGYSNQTDVTTAGYLNEGSVYAGSGASGSANFGICNSGVIEFLTPQLVESMAITNTTYAALSMIQGDFAGKIFGSTTDANGDVDGTNGEDFFFIRIVGRDVSGNALDSLDFYLADYRFADSTQDYILDTWSTVDLSSFGVVSSLSFEFQSSDVGDFGINTPTYFAMDNLMYTSLGVSENSTNQFVAYPNPTNSSFSIKGEAGTISIYSPAGKLVHQSATTGFTAIDAEAWASGMYIVELNGTKGISRSTVVKN